MEFASEMLVMASKREPEDCQVPIEYYPRVAPSKLHSFADGLATYPVRAAHEAPSLPCHTGLLFSVVRLLLMAFFSLKGNVESSRISISSLSVPF